MKKVLVIAASVFLSTSALAGSKTEHEPKSVSKATFYVCQVKASKSEEKVYFNCKPSSLAGTEKTSLSERKSK